MEHANPILSTFAVGGQTRQLTSYESPKPQNEKNVPAAILKLIADLGFRYRPTSQTDLVAHAHALKLLGEDLADMPPHLLERAIAKHAVSVPYLPKASDLVALAKTFINNQSGTHGPVGESLAQRGNRMMIQERYDIVWRDDGTGGAYLDWAR